MSSHCLDMPGNQSDRKKTARYQLSAIHQHKPIVGQVTRYAYYVYCKIPGENCSQKCRWQSESVRPLALPSQATKGTYRSNSGSNKQHLRPEFSFGDRLSVLRWPWTVSIYGVLVVVRSCIPGLFVVYVSKTSGELTSLSVNYEKIGSPNKITPSPE